MPVKHIPEAIWRKVEKELVKAVIETKKPVKESQILEVILKVGIKNITKKRVQVGQPKKAGEI